MVKMIESGIGDQPRCFAVGEMTDILERDAAMPGSQRGQPAWGGRR
jgi:hypothetical protein